MKLEKGGSTLVDGVEVFPIPGWVETHAISRCGRVWIFEKLISRRAGALVPQKARWAKYQTLAAGYAAVRLIDGPRKKFCMVHRLLAETFLAPPNTKWEVDHKDGDTRNNSLDNLRVTDRSGNRKNTRIHRNNTSGYKGVCTTSRRYGKPWEARISCKGVRLRLGRFDDPVEAAKAYDTAALKHFGPFAAINFPTQSRPTRSALRA